MIYVNIKKITSPKTPAGNNHNFPAPETVRGQLYRLLQSPDFQASALLSRRDGGSPAGGASSGEAAVSVSLQRREA